MGGVSSSINLKGDVGKFAKNMAGGIAGAAATSLVTGRNFGDTLMSQLPSIIGNTVGSLIGSAVSRSSSSTSLNNSDNGEYDLPSLADYAAARVILPDSFGDSLSLTALNVSASGNRDVRDTDIVVTAQKNSMYAVKYISDAGQFDAVEAIALMQGYLHPNQQNTYYRQLVGNIIQGSSNVGGAPSIGPVATIGHIGIAFGRGMVSAVAGFGQTVALGWAANANIPVVSSIARSRIMSIDAAKTVQGAFGAMAYIVDQAIVHDNILPAAEAAGGAFAGGGIGQLSSTLVAMRTTSVAAEGVSLNGANFAQKTFKATFSKEGAFAGRRVSDVAADIRAGRISPSDVPLDFIVREGRPIILNTRSSQALEQAGISRNQWNGINRTGNAEFELRLDGQLSRNRLGPQGTPTVRSGSGH